jgi:hypothetical protein
VQPESPATSDDAEPTTRWDEPATAPVASAEQNGDGPTDISSAPDRAPAARDDDAQESEPADDMWSLRARLAEAASRKRDGLE